MRPVIFPLCLDLKKFDGHHKTHYQDKIEGRVTLSFIGRITPKKRIDLIFAALKVLPAETKAKLIFQVVGTDNEGLWNKEEYTEEEIGVPIMYRGPLYDNELFNAYHKTDVFILCSESENFAISVVEAAYCYCVPFISKEVGVSEYFSEESAVYADLDELDICQKLDHLIRNPEELAKYKLEARKVSEQFDSSLLPDGYFKELLK